MEILNFSRENGTSIPSLSYKMILDTPRERKELIFFGRSANHNLLQSVWKRTCKKLKNVSPKIFQVAIHCIPIHLLPRQQLAILVDWHGNYKKSRTVFLGFCYQKNVLGKTFLEMTPNPRHTLHLIINRKVGAWQGTQA